MLSPVEQLRSLPDEEREGFLSTLTEEECESLLHDWRGFLARPEQVAPDGDWDIWMILAGRGFGKTRTGAEWVREMVASGAKRGALIGETAADTRDVMVEGESGILSVYPPGEGPEYEPSKRRLTWPNGATATLFNATEPNQLRGPQYDFAWSDELAKWRYARETWDQLQFGLRLGDHPRQIVTTTPRPIELVKAIVAGEEGRAHITRGKTLDNQANLAKPFIDKIQKRYAGTRLGRQELDGEILGDLPGAIWTQDNIDLYRVSEVPSALTQIRVAVDPAVTNTEDSDEHGILVVATDDQGHGYVLQDASATGSPKDWARRAIAMYDEWEADSIVVEVNQGGDMVRHTLESVRPNVPIVEVRASRGKHVRAEPIASVYEQGRAHHVGSFPKLEAQMTLFSNAGYEGEGSPDRVDALVWGFTDLFDIMTRRPAKKRPRRRHTGTAWGV